MPMPLFPPESGISPSNASDGYIFDHVVLSSDRKQYRKSSLVEAVCVNL
jgi:hypothetical protein